MPSKKQYNLVPNDEGDTRIPLHSDEAFHHGITFQAKYIGSMDVPRPSSRVEIVAAMRRIRYEFKAKGVKKKKVLLEVSVDGVRVSLRKKKKKKQWMDDSGLLLMHHPVYRIFYVSHDSQDLKIFSYIARDGASNVFRCNVFKSNKKNQAMRVVRTVGQAFEVCHKLSIGPGSPARDDHSERDSEGASDKTTRKGALSTQLSVDGLEDSVQDSGSYDDSPRSPPPRGLRLDLQRPRSPQVNRKDMNGSPLPDEVDRDGDRDRGERDRDREPSAGSLGGGSLLHHEVQLLREQLEQQVQQTQAAMAQVNLLRDQLAAEKAARMEAQARTHQLLGHNRELLDHITALVAHLQEQEGGAGGSQPLQLAPQLSSAAKVARWFELLQTPAPLSRPESGFVSGAQSGDLGGSEEVPADAEADAATDAATDADALAVSDALSRLPARKRKKLFKLKLGRNVTF